MNPAPPVISAGPVGVPLPVSARPEPIESYREPSRCEFLPRGAHAVVGLLPLEPLGQLHEPLVERHPRLVTEPLPGERDVREAMADVADPVLAP